MLLGHESLETTLFIRDRLNRSAYDACARYWFVSRLDGGIEHASQANHSGVHHHRREDIAIGHLINQSFSCKDRDSASL